MRDCDCLAVPREACSGCDGSCDNCGGSCNNCGPGSCVACCLGITGLIIYLAIYGDTALYITLSILVAGIILFCITALWKFMLPNVDAKSQRCLGVSIGLCAGILAILLAATSLALEEITRVNDLKADNVDQDALDQLPDGYHAYYICGATGIVRCQGTECPDAQYGTGFFIDDDKLPSGSSI